MASSSAAAVAELDDDDHHHDEDLEHRLSGDRLLAGQDPMVLDSVISTDSSKPALRHKRWLLYLAAASSLLWCVRNITESNCRGLFRMIFS